MELGPSSYEEKIKEINRNIIADPFIQHVPVDERHVEYLLLVIKLHAGDQLHESRDQMMELLDEKEDLKERLMTGWRNKSFEQVLMLDYLRRSASPSRSATPQGSESELHHMQKVIQAAWNVPYEGDYHRLLRCNMNKMKRYDPYTNICYILQSSGTGKSRMVDELAKLVFTIPMNVQSEGKTRVAYPPPDDSLRDFFVNVAGDADAVKGHYLAFFSSLFSHAADELKRVESSLQHPSEEQFATRWREMMCDSTYRRNFYETVITSCKTDGKLSSSTHFQKANDSLDKLVNALNKRYESFGPVKVVIYIDGAHALNIHFWSGLTRLDVLCSAIADFSYFPLSCILLSTRFSLQLPAPPLSFEVATSERARLPRGELRPPITETPFDCAPHMKISPGDLRLDHLIKVDFLAKWGRPLWWTILEGDKSGQEKSVDLEWLLDLARTKLLHGHSIYTPLLHLRELARVAVVDVLLGLDFEPGREQTDRQADMVANHMRIAYSVSQHREDIRSGYSSEPLLAEAAARQIYEFQSNPGHDGSDVMVKVLAGAFDRSWIDVGQRGEVVMRLLLMRAYMDAVREDHLDDPPIFSRGCHLVTFINNLFSRKPADIILNSKPDNVNVNTTFRDVFKSSMVRFTHFVKAGDDSVLTTEALSVAFARGMAFICPQTQKYVDFMIPVLLNETDTLEEVAMSAVIVQVKRHIAARDDSYGFVQEDIGLFPDSKPDRPYFLLVAELAGKWDENEKETIIHVHPQPEARYSAHLRFQATVHGCSADLYNAVGTDNSSYMKLLASRNFSHKHPRQNPESRSAVMNLKPFWNYGKDSYHWVESEELNES